MDAIEILAKFGTPAGRADPYPLYAALHELGDVVPAGADGVLVVGYRVISSVLRDPGFRVCDQTLFDRRLPGWRESPALVQVADWLLNVNEPRHARMRNVLARTFTPWRVAGLEPAISEVTDGLLDAIADRGADGSAVEFMHDFAFLLPITVICELVGIPEADREGFRPLVRDLAGIFELGDAGRLPAIDAAAARALAYFTDLAAERRRSPRDDLFTDLLAISDLDGGRLTSAELLHNVTMLVVAGFETSTHLLGNGLQIALRDPAVGAAVRSGSVPAAAFVEEVLRFDPPVQHTKRVGYDTSVGGVPVSEQTILTVVLAAGNRDPRRFSAPSRFDPLRKDGAVLSFGGGVHFCIGAALARMEGAVAFPRLFNRFPGISAAGEPARQDRLLFLRGFDELPVTIN